MPGVFAILSGTVDPQDDLTEELEGREEGAADAAD